jgi:uncharacterized protein (TIGR03382 family)
MGRGLGQQRGRSLHAQVSHSNQRKRGEESVGSPGSFSRPFQVKAALVEQRQRDIITGDEILLHIFANRENKAIRYTWVVLEQPKDGDVTITNPKGAVSFSNSVQYVYENDRAAKFIPRAPGEYTVELQAELAFEDDGGYEIRAAKSQMKILVGGETLGGCAAVPASTPALFALVGLALLRRRRR